MTRIARAGTRLASAPSRRPSQLGEPLGSRFSALWAARPWQRATRACPLCLRPPGRARRREWRPPCRTRAPASRASRTRWTPPPPPPRASPDQNGDEQCSASSAKVRMCGTRIPQRSL
eukprot:1289996-Pleurochrysis_carterae.AAC.2